MTAAAKHRLLLVEDEVSNHPIYPLLFQASGFDVDVAQTGLDAWTKLSAGAQTYHAVVLDIMLLPGGSEDSEWSLSRTGGGTRTGLLVLEKMMEMAAPPPVWVITGNPDSQLLETIRAFPHVKECLAKGISLAHVAETIHKHLDSGVRQ